MKKYFITLAFLLFLSPFTSIAQTYYYSVSTTSPSCISIDVNLRYQDTDATKGNTVTILQNFLHNFGYLSDSPTGYFGAHTKAAVISLQTKYGLSANPPGFVGPQTRQLIAEISCGQNPPIATQATTTPTQSVVAITTPIPTNVTAPSLAACANGDRFNVFTGQSCSFTQTGVVSNQTPSTQTVSLNPPSILPFMLLTNIVPVLPFASTSRDVAVAWQADTTQISMVNIGLLNNSSQAVIDIASSTANLGADTVKLTTPAIPDGSYSFIVYWPTNHLANSTSPSGTVIISSGLITINQYPSTSTASTALPTGDLAAEQAAYQAQAAQNQDEINKDKEDVKNADTPEKKQSALQKLCEGYKFFLDPADCSFIKLTGI